MTVPASRILRPGLGESRKCPLRRVPSPDEVAQSPLFLHRRGCIAARASGHNRTTDLALRYAGKLHPEEVRRRRAFLHGSPRRLLDIGIRKRGGRSLAVSLDKPLEWAVGFFFGNTELSLGL